MNKDHKFGPQYKRDTQFTARMRFHQSWYRASILKLPYGIGPKKHSKNKYGSMLTEQDGRRGKNFLSDEIFLLAKDRFDQNTGMVDEYRLFQNMLSSMPMCFNLFGPLKLDLGLGSRLLKALLPGTVSEVTNILFEFHPTPRKHYLNDRTAFDIFVEFLDMEGALAFIGIEVKLTEPFSQAQHENPMYDFWMEKPDSPWKPGCHNLLVHKDVNQLWRNHLLVQALVGVQSARYSNGLFLTIYHPLDVECTNSLEKYFSYLGDNHNASHYSMENICEIWDPLIQDTDHRSWFDQFKLRYLDLSASEEAFQEGI